MLDLSDLLPLLGQAIALLLIGLIGCAAAEKLKVPRLVGGVVTGAFLAFMLSATPTDDPALARYLEERAKDRKDLESTGVTPIAIEEFDVDTEKGANVRRAEFEAITDRRTLHATLALGFPCVALTWGVALFVAPRRPGFARGLPFMLAGAFSAAAISFLLGWLFLSLDWITTERVSEMRWVIGLALGCAVGSSALPRDGDPASGYPLWRWVFEPLLYGLVGASVDLRSLNWVLPLLVIVLFGDGKALGALLLRRYISRRSWEDSFPTAALIARGSPAALATAYSLHALGMIDAPLFTSLVIAAVATSLVGTLAVRILRHAI